MSPFLDAYLRNLHTFEFLWKIMYIFYWSKSTSYWNVSFFHVQIYFLIYFDNLVRAFFWLFGRKLVVKIESVIFLSQNGKYEIL